MARLNPVPEGYHTITPYLIVRDAAKAIEFYKRAFDAKEMYRMETPEGKIGHCELQLGDSRIMMADEMPEANASAPGAVTGNSFSLLIYTDNVDLLFKRAIEAGAKVLRPLRNEFYGDRMGTLQDPFNHIWNLGQHVEDVSPDELQKRAEQLWHQKSAQ